MTRPTLSKNISAFAISIPIGTAGGLIGLGGAEFRLPFLVGALGYSARQAVPVNLAISLATVVTSLLIRSATYPAARISQSGAVLLSLIAGAVIAAFYGTQWVSRIRNDVLERIILALLTAIGGLLILESLLPGEVGHFIPHNPFWQIPSGVLFGLLIGAVSSLLGVAGGELIIPTLIFAYGLDIKTAGSASLLVSLPTVCIGVYRYWRNNQYAQGEARKTILSMSSGSIIGALIGGALVGIIPAALLKAGLGIILCLSALRVFWIQQKKKSTQETLP